jgi:hypothetical protein
LLFKASYWSVQVTYQVYLHRQEVSPEIPLVDAGGAVGAERIYQFQEVALAVSTEGTLHQLDPETLLNVVAPRLPFTITKDMWDEFRLATHGFTCAAFKSLMQKLIRFAPQRSVPPCTSPPEAVLVMTLCHLAAHSGVFLPELQRFVTGLESIYKRLVIIAVEDSFTERPLQMLHATACAFLAQRVKGWKPTQSSWTDLVLWALELMREPRAFQFSAQPDATKPPFQLQQWRDRPENQVPPRS